MNYRVLLNGFLFLIMGVSITHAQTWNWKTIYEESLASSHAVKILDLNKEQALTQQKQVRGAYIPRVQMQAKAGYMDARSTVNIDDLQIELRDRTIEIPEINSHLNTHGWLGSGTAEASFLLFSGTKVTHLSNAAEASSEAQKALIEKESQELLLEVLTLMDQYALLLTSDELITTAQENLEENQKVAQKAYEYGIITSYEKEQVALAASELDVKKVQLNGQKQLLLSKISQLTNSMVKADDIQWPELSELFFLLDNHNADLRPEIKALNAKLKAETSLINLEKSWWIPQFQAKASLGYMGTHFMQVTGETPLPIRGTPIDFRVKDAYLWPQWQVGVGMKWDLFDGLHGSRATKIARLEKQKTEEQKNEALSLIQLEQQKYAIENQTAQEEVKALKKQSNYRFDALEMVEKEFKLGLVKSTDLVDAHYKYQEAKMNEAQAIFKQRQSVYQQLRSEGRLNIETVQTIIK